MKKDLTKLLLLIWMCVTAFLMFKIYVNLDYIVELLSAYVRLAIEYTQY